MGKIYGKDGSIYHDPNEAVRANARWDQQQKQNELIKEQNKLLKQQNNSNSSSLGIDYETLKSMSPEERADFNKFVSKYFIMAMTIFIPIVFFACKLGFIDAIVSIPFYMFGISIYELNEDHNAVGVVLFSIYIVWYIYEIIKYNRNKNIVKDYHQSAHELEKEMEEIEKEDKKIDEELEELEREANTKMEKEYEPENKITNMIDINKFCTLYNENLQKYYKFFGKDLDNEQLESTEINSYRVNKDEFYMSGDEKELNLKFYTAIKNDIKISLLCNENQIVVTASISNTNDIDYISNELIKRIYLPFLSTITAKNIEDSINTWRLITDTDDWKITEDEFSYSLMDDYLFMITNLIFLNFMDRREE